MNRPDQLDTFLLERVSKGQRELADAMRALVRTEAPEVADAVADAGDDPFLEPLLFSYFAEDAPRLGLPQILFGALAPQARPDVIEVHTDDRGRIYLPRVGYLLTDLPDAALMLTWDRGPDRYSLWRDRSTIAARFEPLVHLGQTRVEVLAHANPLLMTRFRDIRARPVLPDVEGHGPEHLAHLERALALIGDCCPTYRALIELVTRQLVVFRYPEVNSFASINLHGAALFNSPTPCDEVYFCDELVHQCGHVIFNAATVRRREFLAMDPERALNEIAPRELDGRTIYDAFHGLFTEYAMSKILRELDERQILSGSQAHELYGRLSFITRKFRVDVRNLGGDGVFTPLGQDLYRFFARACAELVAARPELLTTNMSGQGYNFDHQLFSRSNLPRRLPESVA